MDITSVARVAIITRTKNRPILLRRAIESVLGQTFKSYLHVIVNDGGNAAEVDLLLDEYSREYKGRVKVLHNPLSVGMQNASNLGIHASQSEFITIHDDDDSWHEGFLSEGVSVLDAAGPDSSYQGVATQSIRINESVYSDGRIVETSRENYIGFDSISIYRMAANNLFPPIAFLYRRAVHATIGYFDEKFTVLGDWDFNLRFIRQFDIAASKRVLAYYHWRMTDERNAYNNSVTAGIDEHLSQQIVLQNHYLREDLQSGKIGLGHLMCHSKLLHGVADLGWQNYHITADVRQRVEPKPPPEKIRKFLQKCWSLTDVIVPPPKPKPAVELGPQIAPITVKDIREKMKMFKALSLDVFDTALVRVVRKPTDVFHAMAAQARVILNNKDLAFTSKRILAERTARRLSVKRGNTDEITLTQIYEAFDPDGEWDRKLVDKLVALEYETEGAFLYANPPIYDLYVHAKSLGLPAIYLSDMYLPAEFIRKLLIKNDFEVDKLFVSSKEGVSKHQGELYQVMLQAVGLQPDEILHLGDNHTSDYTNAKRSGITAIHTEHLNPRALVDQIPLSVIYEEGDLVSSVCLGLARRHASQYPAENLATPAVENAAFWKTLGYEVAGPLTFLFLHWLVTKAKAAEVKRLFFFSRDGYLLVKAFEVLKKRWNLNLEADYLYASRRLFNFARIKRLDNQAVDFLLTPNPGLKIRDFLERAGLDVEEHSPRLKALGLPALDTVITSSEGQFLDVECRVRLKQFLTGIEEDLLRRCRDEKERLCRYLDEKSFSLEGTAVVDVGWRASLCQSLQELMSERGQKGQLKSYLFGTWNYAENAIDSGCKLESYFFHLDQPGSRKALISECVEIVELFFSAPHPSVIGLQEKDGAFTPIYGTHEYDASQLAQTELMRTSALEFVRDASELLTDANAFRVSDTYAEAILQRLLRHPTIDEARILGRFPHRDGFGDKGPLRYLANPLSPRRKKLNPKELRFAYDHSYWKAGFRVQLSEEEKRSINL